MPETTNFNIPYLDGTELVRDYPTFSEDLADAVDAGLGSVGKILQVVSDTTTTVTTIATTALTDTTLKATITPSSTSSKILVMCSLQTRSSRQTLAVTSNIAIDRAGTVVFQNISRSLGGAIVGASAVAFEAYQSLTFLDSPNTTSATEYTILAAPGAISSAGILTVQRSGSPSSIVLMEVAV